VYVNLFIASELDWQEEDFRLRQDTKYPESEHTALTVVRAGRRELTIRLRVPGWLRSSPVVKVNGKALDASAAPGSYLTLTRAWKAGDRVEMELPMHVHMESMPDEPGTQALLWAARAGWRSRKRGLTGAHRRAESGVGAPDVEQHGAAGLSTGHRLCPGSRFQRFGRRPGRRRIQATDQAHVFRTLGQRKDVTLVPLNRLFDRRYSVYWQVTS
jgi:hypothetical protein